MGGGDRKSLLWLQRQTQGTGGGKEVEQGWGNFKTGDGKVGWGK